MPQHGGAALEDGTNLVPVDVSLDPWAVDFPNDVSQLALRQELAEIHAAHAEAMTLNKTLQDERRQLAMELSVHLDSPLKSDGD